MLPTSTTFFQFHSIYNKYNTVGNWKKNRKTVTTICKTCGCSFEKIKSEYDRAELKFGNHYCSRNCCGKDNIKKQLGKWYGKGNATQLISNNGRDEFTGFRDFLRRAKNRDKLGDLTLVDLKEQWEKQKGMCPYTGIQLKLSTYSKLKKPKIHELASLDRINSNKLYEKGNVVFVSTPINYMKNTMTEKETIKFCKIIASFWQTNGNKQNLNIVYIHR